MSAFVWHECPAITLPPLYMNSAGEVREIKAAHRVHGFVDAKGTLWRLVEESSPVNWANDGARGRSGRF